MEKYDREGNEIGLMDWAERFENEDYRVLAVDYVGTWQISTVWIGLDYGWGRSEKPLIFETAVFDNSPEGLNETQEIIDKGDLQMKACLGPEAYGRRVATEEEAFECHKEAVVAAEAGLIRREDPAEV